MEEQEYIELRPQPAYALCTFGQYFKLNHDLSIAKGYDLNKSTERVLPMNPPAAKTDIQYDAEGNETGYAPKLVAELSSENQMLFPELIDGLELVDSYVHVDEPVQELIVNITDLPTLDWTLMHFLVAGGTEDNLQLIVSNETASMLPAEMLAGIGSMGLNIVMQ